MKYFTMLISLTVASVTIANNDHLSQFDEMRLQLALKNDRLFHSYYQCLLDLGKCNESALTLKRLIPKALSTGCADCSEKQKSLVKSISKYMIPHRPTEWQQIREKYDPENKYAKKFGDFLQA